jgi:hypothetical protein
MNNPFLPGPNFNLTKQGEILRANPGLAESMKNEAAKIQAEHREAESFVKTLGDTISPETYNGLSPEQKAAFGSLGGSRGCVMTLAELAKDKRFVSDMLSDLFQKHRGFLKKEEIYTELKKREITDKTLINGILDDSVYFKSLDFESGYGYYRKGKAAALKADIQARQGKPSMTRADYDKLSAIEQSNFIRGGGFLN